MPPLVWPIVQGRGPWCARPSPGQGAVSPSAGCLHAQVPGSLQALQGPVWDPPSSLCAALLGLQRVVPKVTEGSVEDLTCFCAVRQPAPQGWALRASLKTDLSSGHAARAQQSPPRPPTRPAARRPSPRRLAPSGVRMPGAEPPCRAGDGKSQRKRFVHDFSKIKNRLWRSPAKGPFVVF